MAINYWQGTTDDYLTVANWTEASYPADADEVIFDGRVTQDVVQGMLDEESGAASKGDFDLLHVKPSFTGDIGTAAEPLCCSPTKVIFEGTGTLHLLCGSATQSTDATIPEVIINSNGGTVYLYSNANDGANTCEFTKVTLTRGTLYIDYYDVDTDDQGCYVANLFVMPYGNNASSVTVSIDKDCYKVNGAVPMNIYMGNGSLTTDSQAAIIEMYDGTINFGTALVTAETDLDITTSLSIYGGTFNWYPHDSGNDAYVNELHVYGGSFVSSANTNQPHAKALGGGAGNDIYLYPGGTINIANNYGNISIAASSQLWNFGGVLTTDRGAQIAISYDQP